MSKDDRRAEAARDKNVPINFSLEVSQLCDAIIGSQEHVHFPGALSGDSGKARADVTGKSAKRHWGGS